MRVRTLKTANYLKDIRDNLENTSSGERAAYGLRRNSSISKDLATAISSNFKGDFDESDRISLSDRSDFAKMQDHYESTHNLLRTNLSKTTPSVLAHELGHAFSMGRDVRGYRGLFGKAKFYGQNLAKSLGTAAVILGAANLASSQNNNTGLLSGGSLIGAGVASQLAAALGTYSEEANASATGLEALRKALSNPEGVSIGSDIDSPKRVFRPEEIDNLVGHGRKTLDAALGTYKAALPINSIVSIGLQGLGGAVLGKLLGNVNNKFALGATALVGAILARKMESTMASSRPGTKEREEMYRLLGDKSVTVLPSRRLRN
jgi:hypothetical protein